MLCPVPWIDDRSHPRCHDPNYILVTRLGWLDTLAALIVPQLSSAFGVFMLRQHLLSIPNDLFDAAAIDGAGSWRALWQIVFPVMRPALVRPGGLILSECLESNISGPSLVLTKSEVQTNPVGAAAFCQWGSWNGVGAH